MRTLLSTLLIALLCSGAHAQDRGHQQAQRALELFKAACADTFGIEMKVGEWAAGTAAAELSPESARAYLRGRAGRIWIFANELGKFTLISQDGGNCTIQAERAKAASLKVLYSDFLRELPGEFKTTLIQEGTRATPMGDLYSIVHDSESEARGIVLRTLMSTSESDSAYMQGLITLQSRRR